MSQRDEIHGKVWRAIEGRNGAPVSRQALCRWLDVPDRTLREIIRELNIQGFPVVAVEHAPGGYKLGTPEECRAAAATLRAKAASLFERAHGLEPRQTQEALW
jgi:hypothetical protein